MKNKTKKITRLFRIKEISPNTYVVTFPFWLIFRLCGLSFLIILGFEYDIVKTMSEAKEIRDKKRFQYVYTKRNMKIL